MEDVMESKAVDQSAMMVMMVFDGWNALMKDFNTVLDSVTDDQLEKQIAPNKNRGIYVLGHMVAVHDDMLPILGFGEKLYPEINQVFKSSDKEATRIPSAKELRQYWKQVNEVLSQGADALSADQWLEKHNSVSAEDFATQPHRNKLNVMMTRTFHLSYHLGQMKWVQ
jgi:hypothetical protein